MVEDALAVGAVTTHMLGQVLKGIETIDGCAAMLLAGRYAWPGALFLSAGARKIADQEIALKEQDGC